VGSGLKRIPSRIPTQVLPLEVVDPRSEILSSKGTFSRDQGRWGDKKV